MYNRDHYSDPTLTVSNPQAPQVYLLELSSNNEIAFEREEMGEGVMEVVAAGSD